MGDMYGTACRGEKTHFSVGCAVLAAGQSRRFGEDKLSRLLDGRSLLEWAFRAVPTGELSAAAVVLPGYGPSPAADLAARYGFSVLRNPRPALGISGSVRIGTEALMDRCDAILFQTADQPLLRRETVKRLVSLWRENPSNIAALSHGGVRGNPCIFPARFFPELLILSGDRGGSVVIRRHPSDLILLEADAAELMDADTPEDLERIAAFLQ